MDEDLDRAAPWAAELEALTRRGHNLGPLFERLQRALHQGTHGLAAVVAQARDLVAPAGATDDQLDGALLAAQVREIEGDWLGAAEALVQLMPELRQRGRPDRTVAALTALGDAQIQLGRFVYASAYLREAMVLAREHGLDRQRGAALFTAGLLHVHLAQLDTTRAAYQEALALMGTEVPAGWRVRVAANLGYCALLARQPAQAERELQRGLAEPDIAQWPLAHAVLWCNLAWARAALGQAGPARQAWQRARALQRRHGLRRLLAALALNHGRVLAVEGRHRQAMRLAELARRRLDREGRPLYREEALAFLAEQAAALGLWSSAARLSGELAERRRESGARVLDDLAEGIDSVLMHAREHADQRDRESRHAALDRRVAEATRALDEAESRVRWLAERDSVTLLANRRALEHALPQRLHSVSRLLVVSLCLPQLQELAAVIGPGGVDGVLRQVGRWLLDQMGEGSVFVHRDGQFVLCCDDSSALDDPAAWAQVLCNRVQALPSGTGTPLAVSIGWSRFPADGLQSDQLLQQAELASAGPLPAGGRRLRAYHPRLREEQLARTRTEADLRRALRHGELRAWQQPQVALTADGPRVGVEALVRWQHPQRGLLGPVDFIDVAEDSGLVVEIDRWMLAQALAWAADARRTGRAVPVAVNLSARTWGAAGFVPTLQRLLAETGVPPSLLELELTEASLLEAQGPALDGLRAARALGVRVALDDFGTGYSSLAYLRSLPVDVLKIDRSFVQRLPEDRPSEAIVALLVGLAQALSLDLVAEGLEHPRQAACLAGLGVPRAQGFLWGRPTAWAG
ncbi:EAL domain-containing protein [Ideonella sp. 4Y11]|uniref:EAL domain-containing protein n=1 Tax=Ideonella aquatica TaxID=2824119 RepID=A0A940YKI6_9BURK|nr:GGDEF domain-containing phosphodiesterase [Ideonella aquatica]MBQ0960347.1 EAL domain-containing protein [Ideonella aquatica]